MNATMNLDSQLAQLESAQLVRRHTDPSTGSGELAYLFKHTLVQETAYASLLRQERRRLHRAVAETLERAYPERLDEFAPMLAAGNHVYVKDENLDGWGRRLLGL